MLFYVYVDWTTEPTPRPFYVGKGKWSRVQELERNEYHTNISKKYGFRREVIVETTIEQVTLDYEVELIAQLKTQHGLPGHWGANFTSGGDGVCNPSPLVRKKQSDASKQRFRDPLEVEKIMVKTRGKKRTKAARQKMRDAKLGITKSDETKQRMRDSQIRRFQDPAERAKCTHIYTDEERRRIGDATRSRPSPNVGRKYSEETKQKNRETQLKRFQDPTERAKCGNASRGKPGTMRGRKLSEETRQRMRAGQLRRFGK